MRRVGRNREKHKRLPIGWAFGPARQDGARTIYFKPTNTADRAIVKAITGGPLVLRLGATMDEASETFARLIIPARTRDLAAEPGTVAEIMQRARLEYLPSIENAKTREERERHIDALDAAFGQRRYARNVYEASKDNSGLYLRAMDAQRRLFDGRKDRPVAANREARTGELVFQWARAPWGLTEYNPFAGLTANPERPRRVVPADGSIFTLYRELDVPARFMVGLIRYYGRRKVEILGLKLSDVREDGLHFRRGKDADAKPIIVKWDPRLRRMLARVQRWREEVIRPTRKNKAGRMRKAPAIVSTALLLNQRGRAYTATGFNSARKRAMLRAGIAGEFTFHDMRKSRGQSLDPLEAMNVLAHDDLRTTQTKYRPGAIVVDLNDEVAAKRKAK
jgi:hypothetical protein